jgi:hypothetical protein
VGRSGPAQYKSRRQRRANHRLFSHAFFVAKNEGKIQSVVAPRLQLTRLNRAI